MNITEALKETKSLNFVTKTYIKQIELILSDGEDVIFASELSMVKNPDGNSMNNPKIVKGNIRGIFVITKMRILFYWLNNLIPNHKEMSLDSIKDIDVTSKLMIASVRITSYSETWIFSVPQGMQSVIAKKIGDARNMQSSTEQKLAPSSDVYDEIRKLKSLLDDGIIGQDEFEQKKRQLLGLQ